MKVGILAGGGEFPLRVAQAAGAAGHQVFVVCIRDFADPALFAGFDVMTERLGASGAIVERLRAEGVSHIALAGKAKRPSLLALWPDAWTARALAKIGKAAFAGDDGLLRSVIDLLQGEGFQIISPQALLENASAGPGLLAGPPPDAIAKADILRGMKALQCMACLDIGQAIVIQQGLVLGVEAIEGTDALLARSSDLRREGPGGILVKMAKSGQELRVDAPVIGVQTVLNSHEAGVRGIAFEADRTVIADKAETLSAAERLGIFLVGITPEFDTQ